MANTTGANNVATGPSALSSNTTGDINVATGASALSSNTTGFHNVADRQRRAGANTTGTDNVATGAGALLSNTTGDANVATGHEALSVQHDRQQQRRHRHQRAAAPTRPATTTSPPAINALLNATGSANVAIGRNAGQNLTTGSNNVDIANPGKAGESGTIRIGTDATQTATFIAGISGTTLGGATQPVVVKSNGKLGTAPAASASTASLAATVERLQRQVERLRKQVKGG